MYIVALLICFSVFDPLVCSKLNFANTRVREYVFVHEAEGGQKLIVTGVPSSVFSENKNENHSIGPCSSFKAKWGFPGSAAKANSSYSGTILKGM